MALENSSPHAVTLELGERLRQARLNADMTQAEVAERAGVSRKVVVNAEKGHVQLESLVAIMLALDLAGQLDGFLPRQEVSPVQLLKLQGRKRLRASGARSETSKEKNEW
ncbi:helix-turn-helix transcriptional regulator [Pseudomonas putida]|uniref:Helix-turn-helix transcriptional regulator n=1 Tax=Pseudomonas putida TaxID=303 RepID=A0A8I1JI96_PSEPU|nr:helix-turn-helix transcriptional regulator [Pseudomonas putida]MBI6882743.1 helix-turn-helix transcriptional regulator [Pseudomonas putida]